MFTETDQFDRPNNASGEASAQRAGQGSFTESVFNLVLEHKTPIALFGTILQFREFRRDPVFVRRAITTANVYLAGVINIPVGLR
mmetsp:Transcript_48394/g.71725  ORF Transcript_48394/g.71725 Transcript_48394/m.71725 type:complete len:85 (-) Transcript_48394:1091-1345(-)